LNSRVFSGVAAQTDNVYNDIPVYGEEDNVVWQGRTGSGYGEGVRSNRTGMTSNDDFGRPNRASTWHDDVFDRPSASRANPSETFDRLESSRGRSNSAFANNDDYVYSDKPKPSRPTAPKPTFSSQALGAKPGQAIAKFTFEPDQPGDLGFKKGDIITIVKKTDNEADWWTGSLNGKNGLFPSNYVQLV